ncbi:MAG: hypothetical protein IH593_07830 [Bacteroidales bacterium]|nr:hypothetical protein [Bacteroidales bacterium]
MGKKNIKPDEDPVFLLQGEDGEIYFIDDLDMIYALDATVQKMKGKTDDEIAEQLLKIVNPERYGNGL